MRQLRLPGWRTPIFLAVVSFAAALVVWMVVTEAESPRRRVDFSALIEVSAVNVPEGLAVARMTPPAVKITISAEDETLDQLTTADFLAEIDLVGLSDGTSEAIVLVRVVSDLDVDIAAVEEPRVEVELEPVATKQLTIVTEPLGQVEAGFSLNSTEAEPSFVRITGAVSLVDLVTRAVAEVDVEGLRASGERVAIPALRDGRGVNVRGLAIEPSQVSVQLTITQEEVALPLSVVPDLQGRVAEGFNIAAVTIEPPLVTVRGALEAIQGLKTVMTEEIDLTGLMEGFSRSVPLRLPSGIEVEQESVTVSLEIVPTQGEIALTVAPRLTDIPDGLAATPQTSAIVLILRGELTTLRELNASSVNASVSLLDLEEGIHVLTPEVETPAGVELISGDPDQVVIVLSEE